MSSRLQFPFVTLQNSRGEAVLRPLLTFQLQYGNQSREAMGLLDTGADVNVLPYRLGLELGCVWENQRTSLQLSGNLANYEARGVILTAVVGTLPPAKLAFAWTMAENVPLLLGQVNFFAEFDVCFFRERRIFEIGQKQTKS